MGFPQEMESQPGPAGVSRWKGWGTKGDWPGTGQWDPRRHHGPQGRAFRLMVCGFPAPGTVSGTEQGPSETASTERVCRHEARVAVPVTHNAATAYGAVTT